MPGKFAKQTIFTFITRILQVGMGLLTAILIARSLGPEGKGIFSLAFLLAIFLTFFTNLGVGHATIYFLGKKKFPIKAVLGVNILFWLVMSIVSIMTGVVIIFLFADKFFTGVNRTYLCMALAIVPFQIFVEMINQMFLGLQKVKKYNAVQLFQTISCLVCLVFFILFLKLSVSLALLAYFLSFFLSALVLIVVLFKETGGISFSFPAGMLREFSVYGIKSYGGMILSFIHFRIDLLMLNYFLNPAAVGIYSIAVSIAEKLWLLSQSAGLIIFPRVSAEKDKEKLKDFTPLVARNVLFITSIGAIILFFLAGPLIGLAFGAQFLGSVLPLQILLIGMVSISLSRIILYDFSGRGRPMLVTYLNGISLIINVVLNCFLIPEFGLMGAAVATAVSYTVVTILAILIYRNLSGNKIQDIIFIKVADFQLYKRLFKGGKV